MKNFGFIGFGSMAKMLINGLIKYSKVSPSAIFVTRKDKSRLNEIKETFNEVCILETCSDIAKSVDVIFICVKPMEIKSVLSEIAPFITSKHIVSLAGTVSIKNLQSVYNGKISIMIPSITSEIGCGTSLVCHNEHVTEDDAAFFEKSISPFGKVKYVDDKDIGFAAELTSCAPGFIASIFSHFSKIALQHTSAFTVNEINEMIVTTLYATSKLSLETEMSFEQIIDRVATKGGITQEGVIVFDDNLPQVFNDMFEKTLAKRRIVEEKVDIDFHSNRGVCF